MSKQDDNPAPTNDADVQAEGLEDIASQLELEPEEGANVEPEKPESTKDAASTESEKKQDQRKPDGDEPKTEGDKTPESQTEPEKPEGQETEDERKERNRQFYEQRQAERQQQQRQIEQQIDKAYKPQSADELTQKFIDQGYDEFQAQMLARDERREQQSQINEARTHVAELNMQLETEALQVLHDFPVFDPKSDQYDKEFADKASDLYQKAANAQVDEKTGLVVKTSLTPYAFFKQLGEMRGSGVAKAEVKAQKAAEQQMASAAPPSSTPPVTHASSEDKQAQDLESAFNNVL